ncbi:hypothetical protein KP509_34G014600 [Ceratopteris richardii]|uniref:GATA transcription factor 26 n=2 Tax=Ceratopteris richardii TaxID=49495 RepID=A0A8T2QI52_CERRI|nr:hypothetical protein KP509_34G014600 [Ceratopteris richardii]
MGKQGPCCHCGIATTPLWRNGPADKPVLCNACGSRWRTKGTLVNYMPMHSGGLGLKNSSLKKNTCKINGHSLKRKEPSDGLSDSYYSYQRSLPVWGILNEDDACTRSSSGSGMSVSESCAQRPTSSDCWPPWGFHVPSKRRSVMHRHWTASNRFPCFYPSSELCVNRSQPDEELLVEYRSPSMSVEIGLGGVLIRSPTSGTCAQESQASSMMFEKQAIIKHSVNLESDLRKAYTLGAPFSEGIGKQKGKDRTKQFTRSTRAGGNGSTRNLGPNKSLLDNFPYKKRDVLQSCHSPLVFVELKDIINSDTFMSLLTEQEQHQLIKHLSPVDKPDSLKQLFSSAPFESALRGFQDLLSAGMFDAQESGVSTRVLQHYQHLLTTYDLTRSGWIERCSQMRKRKSSADYAKIIQEKEFLEEKLKALNNLGADGLSSSGQLVIEKFIPTSNFGSVVTEVDETPDPSIPSTRCQTFTPMSHDTLDRADQPAEPPSRRRNSFKAHGLEGDSRLKAIQSPKTYQGRKSLMEAPSYGLLEHDVLLDVPSNLSFQQAELLHEPVFYKSPQPKDAGNLVSQSSKTSNAPIQDNVWPNEPNMDWSEFLWNSPSAGSVNDTF